MVKWELQMVELGFKMNKLASNNVEIETSMAMFGAKMAYFWSKMAEL